MIQNINLNGATVTAELHGYMYACVYGYSGVLNYGNKLAYEIVSNNEVKVKDGLLCNKGRFMRVVGSESLTITNGTSGVTRTDLIVAHFETDGINETHDIRVIKGESGGATPGYASGDIYNGGTVCELPLYAVHLNGLSIESVETLFTTLYSLNELSNSVNSLSNSVSNLNNSVSGLSDRVSNLSDNVSGISNSVLTYDEIKSSTDLTGKIASASALLTTVNALETLFPRYDLTNYSHDFNNIPYEKCYGNWSSETGAVNTPCEGCSGFYAKFGDFIIAIENMVPMVYVRCTQWGSWNPWTCIYN